MTIAARPHRSVSRDSVASPSARGANVVMTVVAEHVDRARMERPVSLTLAAPPTVMGLNAAITDAVASVVSAGTGFPAWPGPVAFRYAVRPSAVRIVVVVPKVVASAPSVSVARMVNAANSSVPAWNAVTTVVVVLVASVRQTDSANQEPAGRRDARGAGAGSASAGLIAVRARPPRAKFVMPVHAVPRIAAMIFQERFAAQTVVADPVVPVRVTRFAVLTAAHVAPPSAVDANAVRTVRAVIAARSVPMDTYAPRKGSAASHIVPDNAVTMAVEDLAVPARPALTATTISVPRPPTNA